MTTMMDLRRDAELCLLGGHATYMQIVLARLCYINKVLINTNEADAQIRVTIVFSVSRLVPACHTSRMDGYMHTHRGSPQYVSTMFY